MSGVAVDEVSPELLEALLNGHQVCDHSHRLPLYFVAGEWCCDRCVGLAQQLLHEAEQARRIKEANPLIFATDIVAERIERPISSVERSAIIRNPRTALRLVGVSC